MSVIACNLQRLYLAYGDRERQSVIPSKMMLELYSKVDVRSSSVNREEGFRFRKSSFFGSWGTLIYEELEHF